MSYITDNLSDGQLNTALANFNTVCIANSVALGLSPADLTAIAALRATHADLRVVFLVDSEAQALRRQAQEGLVQGRGGAPALELPLTLFEDQARRRVALGMILSEVVRANELKVDPERVRARVASIASTYQEPEEVVRWYYSDKRRLADAENVVLEDQVVDWILERAQVTDSPTTFDAVMKPGQTPGGG